MQKRFPQPQAERLISQVFSLDKGNVDLMANAAKSSGSVPRYSGLQIRAPRFDSGRGLHHQQNSLQNQGPGERLDSQELERLDNSSAIWSPYVPI